MKVLIENSYITTITSQLELPDGKMWDDVEDYSVRYGTLHLRFKDGSTLDHDCGEPDNIDSDGFKRPDRVRIFVVKDDGEPDYGEDLDVKE